MQRELGALKYDFSLGMPANIVSKILEFLLTKSALLLTREKNGLIFLLTKKVKHPSSISFYPVLSCTLGIQYPYILNRIFACYTVFSYNDNAEVIKMKNDKFHIYLSDAERTQVIQTLIELKNSLLEQGKYTDVVDDVLLKFTKAKRKHLQVHYI